MAKQPTIHEEDNEGSMPRDDLESMMEEDFSKAYKGRIAQNKPKINPNYSSLNDSALTKNSDKTISLKAASPSRIQKVEIMEKKANPNSMLQQYRKSR